MVRPTKADKTSACLTPRETEVLQSIAQGYTNRQIAELLYLSARTVETYQANVRSKLHIDYQDKRNWQDGERGHLTQGAIQTSRNSSSHLKKRATCFFALT